MYSTLALLILTAAIVVIFSSEFGGTIKKIFSVFWVRLFVPLAFASWLVYTYEPFFYVWTRTIHNYIILYHDYLTALLPFKLGASSVMWVVFLTFLSVAPAVLVNWLHKRKWVRPSESTYLISTIFLVIFALLFVVD